ncbi:MAG TPA: hypothetical protein VKQ30_12225 [Ktedonobacterales bacterium]|nr:hypothetical protein [Ktedonobacterales bacterium]
MAEATLRIRDESTVHFRPLTFLPPGHGREEWIVGHEPSDTAISLPEVGIVAIQHLLSGATVAHARAATSQKCDEDIDVADLVEGLAGLGFVEALDGRRMPETASIGQRWLARVPPAAVAWIYSSPLLIFYAVLAISGPILLLLDSAIRPQAHALLWSASYSVDTITLLVLAPLLLLKHELGHLLAGRGKGLQAELTFGHRLVYLVVVSRIAAVWTLRRRERLLIYSAGMLNDLVFAGVGSLLLFAAQEHLVALAAPLKGLVALLVLSEYLGVAWEFQVFLKTDVYHILADLTGRHDLPEQARALVIGFYRRILSAIRRRNIPGARGETIAERADWLTVGYTLLAVIAIGGTLVWFVVYLIPATVLAIGGETAQVVVGLRDGQWLAALDGAMALAGQSIVFVLLAWSWLREHRARRRRVAQLAEFEIQVAR